MKGTPFVHPMEHLVVGMGRRGELIDLPTVTCAIMGCTSISGNRGQTMQRAYRLVAADLLLVMVKAGRLVQMEPWENERRPEMGGARFELPPGTPVDATGGS